MKLLSWNHPSKHSSWWRGTEDVFKTSSSCLQDIIARRLTNTSWRRLEDVLGRRIANTSWRRLEDVLKTSWRGLGRRKVLRWRRLEDFLKTSWKTRTVCWAIDKSWQIDWRIEGTKTYGSILCGRTRLILKWMSKRKYRKDLFSFGFKKKPTKKV